MTHKQTTLIKQAKERWTYVPPAQQKELVEELKKYQPGTHVIELDELDREYWQTHGKVKAQVVSIIFGMDITRGSEKRYLFLSDIPEA